MALLLCVGVEVNAVTESGDSIVFEPLDSTFTPSGGVYSVLSDDNKTIQISEGVEYANFSGGIGIASGGTLDFSFAGMNILSASGLTITQRFRFGDETSNDDSHKKIQNSGIVNFNFDSGNINSSDPLRRYVISENGAITSTPTIVTNSGGVTNFNINKLSSLNIQASVLNNGGETHFIIKNDSGLDLQNQQGGIINQSGKIIFDITMGDIIADGGSGSGGVTTKNGATTVFNVKNSILSGIDVPILNQNGENTTINIDNAKRTQITPNSLISENNQQPEFIFNIKNNSSALLGASEMRNLKLDFQTSGMRCFL